MTTPHSLLSIRADDSCSSAEMNKAAPTWSKENEEAPQKKRRRRRIRFDEQVAVQAITHVNDFSVEEIADTWYKKAEYQMMRSELVATVRKLARREYKGDTDVYCARGLEFKTPVGARRRKLNKLNALATVLDEQDRQFEENDFNLEALACVYIHCNIASRREAAQRGELDAEEASRLSCGKESLTTLLHQYTSGNREEMESIGQTKDKQTTSTTKRGGVIRKMFTKKR